MNTIKINITKDLSLVDGITHGGVFHSDDIMSTVILALAKDKPEFNIMRPLSITDEMRSHTKYIYDIGMGPYDHHMSERPTDDDGRLLSSVGLLFKDIGRNAIINALSMISKLPPSNKAIEEVLKRVQKCVILPIDADDCGESTSPCFWTTLTHMFRSTELGLNSRFIKCVETTLELFLEKVRTIYEKVNSDLRMEQYLENNDSQDDESGILVMDEFAPWAEYLTEQGIIDEYNFVIFPALRGGYMANCVSIAGTRTPKIPFPKEWGGLSGEALTEKSGVAGGIFCHPGRFCYSNESLDTVIKVCHDLVANQNEGEEEA